MSEEKLVEGVKYDQDKLRYDLVPADSLRQVVDIYTFGARKYADHNWRKGIAFSRIYGALQRHLNAFWEGEDKDPESGRNHLAHAAWGCLTLLNYYDTRKEFDDRIPTGASTSIKNVPVILQETSENQKVFKRKSKVQVYLAGTIHAVEYRKNFKELAKSDDRIIVRDPIEEVDSKILLSKNDFKGHMELVETDKKLIKECDMVVAYVQRYTAGTICEIIYAYENGIPVYLISNDNQVNNDPWIISHISYGFDTIEECINSIIDNDLELKK